MGPPGPVPTLLRLVVIQGHGHMGTQEALHASVGAKDNGNALARCQCRGKWSVGAVPPPWTPGPHPAGARPWLTFLGSLVSFLFAGAGLFTSGAGVGGCRALELAPSPAGGASESWDAPEEPCPKATREQAHPRHLPGGPENPCEP